MKVLLSEDIRHWDQFTITNEPIDSIDLMERAAVKCVEWLLLFQPDQVSYAIFCGKGNNGGDGLAIARILSEKSKQVDVNILESGHKGSEDFQKNLVRLHACPEIAVRFIQTVDQFRDFTNGATIIDALFGSGLNRPLTGIAAALVTHINHSGSSIISIDIPSGLFADSSSKGNAIVEAAHTLSFQVYKQALLSAENGEFIGVVHLLDIGLHPEFYNAIETDLAVLEIATIQSIYKVRPEFGHKGSFGHALIIAGSYGKMGAAFLSATSCLRTGAGLLTCHIPSVGYAILQTALPEAMVMTDFNSSFVTRIEDDLQKYDAVGIGPGLGTASETKNMLREVLRVYRKPLVLDADALNCIALDKELLHDVPGQSILTPHPKEFDRLFGNSENEFDRIHLALQKATEFNIIIVLKGHHTLIATSTGKGFFNSTGNAGMATAGAGDTLTGIVTSLLAQGYSSVEASILGVYLHGLAGDLAAKELSKEAMLASDIIKYLGKAFISIGL